jgi:hypothetical protein
MQSLESADVSEEHWLTFSGLRVIISQTIDLFITTSVRTSNLTKKERFIILLAVLRALYFKCLKKS